MKDMKKILMLLLLLSLAAVNSTLLSQGQSEKKIDKQSIINDLTEIDEGLKGLFPRWKVCEPDLQIQIYQMFKYLKFDPALLSQTDIEIMAAPKMLSDEYTLLIITCGSAEMTAVDIEANLSDLAYGFLNGRLHYKGQLKGELFENENPRRDYCYIDIPTSVPLSAKKTEAIIDYMHSTSKTHMFTLSLFEQSLKIGNSGFWLRSYSGNDDIGYPFWSSGQNAIVMQRPLYLNTDNESRKRIPYLINFYIGGAYRHKSGLDENSDGLFSWVPARKLNSYKSGYFTAGIDFHVPKAPEFGLAISASLPLQGLDEYHIDPAAYAYDVPVDEFGDPRVSILNAPVDVDPEKYSYDGKVATILMASGRASIFYHWWVDKKNPENYFRFDLGLSFSQVEEMGAYVAKELDGGAPYWNLGYGRDEDYAGVNFDGLKTYHPTTFSDWLYFKIDYRNQAFFPFGASAQFSNGMFLGKLWVPLFGDWLYLEAKYSTPFREKRPYEIDNFYMISPIIKLSI